MEEEKSGKKEKENSIELQKHNVDAAVYKNKRMTEYAHIHVHS